MGEQSAIDAEAWLGPHEAVLGPVEAQEDTRESADAVPVVDRSDVEGLVTDFQGGSVPDGRPEEQRRCRSAGEPERRDSGRFVVEVGRAPGLRPRLSVSRSLLSARPIVDPTA
jgi:hypothetical protein